MTINPQSKVPMHAVKSSSDPGASQGARRATEDAPGSAPPAVPPGSDSEVVARARRHTFSNADKRRILQAADLCTKPGEIGALMRREGVYSSSLSTWRRQREATELAALAPHKRGPKVDAAARVDALHIAQLTRERDNLRVELDKAQLVIEVQKNSPRCWAFWQPRTSAGTHDGRRYRTHARARCRRGMSGCGPVAWCTRAPAGALAPSHGDGAAQAAGTSA